MTNQKNNQWLMYTGLSLLALSFLPEYLLGHSAPAQALSVLLVLASVGFNFYYAYLNVTRK